MALKVTSEPILTREEKGDNVAQRDGVEGNEESRMDLMYINSASTLM
jgi:hypothetical protein